MVGGWWVVGGAADPLGRGVGRGAPMPSDPFSMSMDSMCFYSFSSRSH